MAKTLKYANSSVSCHLTFSPPTTRFQAFHPLLSGSQLYISPVGFSSAIVPDRWRLLYSLNPMVGVIDGFRWAIIGGEVQLFWPGFLLSLLLVFVLLFTGILYFRRMERTFADVI
ncbi:hypothetical protein [Leptolyngbya sp. BL0902]|uniref:hypothetical protein n=1 Tax=Leptolyngbya sp. BL0902 TaxID=1115757 RepID=UPI002938D2D6|nr:hypothetical protein [Leptolyngbya sp. BL0902]